MEGKPLVYPFHHPSCLGWHDLRHYFRRCFDFSFHSRIPGYRLIVSHFVLDLITGFRLPGRPASTRCRLGCYRYFHRLCLISHFESKRNRAKSATNMLEDSVSKNLIRSARTPSYSASFASPVLNVQLLHCKVKLFDYINDSILIFQA